MKIALQNIPPLSMRTISSAFGALTLFCVCAVSRRNLRIASAKNWGHVFVIGLLNIGFFGISVRMPKSPPLRAGVTILVYTMPIWAVSASMGGAAKAAKCKTGACHCPVRTRACGVDLSIGERRRALRPGPGPLAAGTTWGAGTVDVDGHPLGARSLGSHILAACDRVPCDCGLSHRC